MLYLQASRFSSALASGTTVTEMTYADPDLPPLARRLSLFSGARRHAILEETCRRLDMHEWHPQAAFNVDADDCEWERDGRRVFLRTAQLRWEAPTKVHSGRWLVRFQRAPFALERTDELLLAMFCPDGVHVVRHDHRLGLAGTGLHADALLRGKQVNIYGASGIRGWRAALELFVLPKLQASGCEVLARVPFEHPVLCETTVTGVSEASGPKNEEGRQLVDNAYYGVPLSEAPSSRRTALARLVRAVDEELLHPDATFDDESRGIAARDGALGGDGARAHRSSWRTACNWQRGGTTRVVCRSAQLLWEAYHRRWRLLFSGVHLPRVDHERQTFELLLAIYSPAGVHICKHNGELGVSRAGATRTDLQGHQIKLHGPTGVTSWREALEGKLLPMIHSARGCEVLAFVAW